MSETLKFKTFCIEQYKNEHRLSGKETVYLFDQYGVLEYLTSFYDVLHSCGGKYLVQDIALFIQARQ